MNLSLMSTCFFFILIISINTQTWIQYNLNASQLILFQKYFHRVRQAYFIQFGAYNPIYLSPTIKLSNWKGIIVEPDQIKAGHIRDYHINDVISLNLQVNNNKQVVQFYYTTGGSQNSRQEVQILTFAALCHKYYKTKPTLMVMNDNRVAQLISNDWQNQKCIPDVIHVKNYKPYNASDLSSTDAYLTSLNYTLIERESNNKLFIHERQLQFYKNQAKVNSQYLKNVTIATDWLGFSAILTELIDRNMSNYYLPRSEPAFIHTRQPNIIDIVEIGKYSNLISQVGLNRPIIILQYNPETSFIYLGTHQYSIQDIQIHNFTFKLIKTYLNQKPLLIYVFDHQHSPFKLQILNVLTNKEEQKQQQIQVVKAQVDYLKIIIAIIVTNVMLFIIYLLIRKYCWLFFKHEGMRVSRQQEFTMKSNVEK